MSSINNTYKLTTHALDRARLRFGVHTDEATAWVNDIMRKARYIATGNGGRMTYEYEGLRIIVGENKHVITIHSEARLDFMRPVIEREIRKLQRQSTKQVRELERHLAKMYVKLGERVANYANAKNPNTRALIAERVKSTEGTIKALRTEIERINDDTQAKIKAMEVIAE